VIATSGVVAKRRRCSRHRLGTCQGTVGQSCGRAKTPVKPRILCLRSARPRCGLALCASACRSRGTPHWRAPRRRPPSAAHRSLPHPTHWRCAHRSYQDRPDIRHISGHRQQVLGEVGIDDPAGVAIKLRLLEQRRADAECITANELAVCCLRVEHARMRTVTCAGRWFVRSVLVAIPGPTGKWPMRVDRGSGSR
jgi:hypothetical protein